MTTLGLYLGIQGCLLWFHFNINLGYRCSSELLLNQCELWDAVFAAKAEQRE